MRSVYTVLRMAWRPERDALRAEGISRRCLATLTGQLLSSSRVVTCWSRSRSTSPPGGHPAQVG